VSVLAISPVSGRMEQGPLHVWDGGGLARPPCPGCPAVVAHRGSPGRVGRLPGWPCPT